LISLSATSPRQGKREILRKIKPGCLVAEPPALDASSAPPAEPTARDDLSAPRFLSGRVHAFERLVSGFLKERSRLGFGDPPVSRAIEGYWNKEKIEIDLILLDDESKTIRFGSCKRNEEKLLKDIGNFSNHVNRFLAEPRAKEFVSWRKEYLLFCPRATEVARHFKLPDACFRVLDLDDLLRQRA